MTDVSRRQLFRAAGALGTAVFAAACTESVTGDAVPVPHPTPPKPPDALAKLRQNGTLGVLGVNDGKPFTYADPAAGITGEAAEVIKAAFTALGVPRVRFELVDYADAQQKMAAMAAAGDTSFTFYAGGTLYDTANCEQFDMVPDFVYQLAFAVPAGNPKQIKTVTDVVSNHRTVAVVAGSTQDGRVRAEGVPSSAVKRFPDPISAGRAVSGGHADCFLYYDIYLRQLAADKMLGSVDVTVGYSLRADSSLVAGFHFPKQDDTSIRDAFATQLDAMRRSGDWLRMASRFGLTQGNQLSPGMGVFSVCH